MRVLVTGSSGRVGRGIHVDLMADHEVVGLDRQPSSTSDFVGDLRDSGIVESALAGAEVLIHTASLHAPHVGLVMDDDFQSINVEATRSLVRLAAEAGVKHVVYTSTTALYGATAAPGDPAAWVTEGATPRPRTIYHTTKIAAEASLAEFSRVSGIPVTVIQMSRCFPEPADLMAIYRLNRGVDARDVARAHRQALVKRLPGFRRFIVSAATPFQPEDCSRLSLDAAGLIREKAPELAAEFDRRSWALPASLDRVYDSTAAQQELDWQPRHGFEAVLSMLDTGTSEVLPASSP
jgi:UDP-glucose 4-epimerase